MHNHVYFFSAGDFDPKVNQTEINFWCAMRFIIKGELNVDKKCQSDGLFYIIMNEIRPRIDQF